MTKCILWAKAKTPRGYGVCRVNGKLFLTHRLALIKKLGRPIKKGYCCCHICDNPACINPDHLFEATQSENILDMFKKNRQKFDANNLYAPKLTVNKVKEIKKRRGENTLKLAQQFGVGRRAIQSIFIGRTWKHI
jgi:hypothetical protein